MVLPHNIVKGGAISVSLFSVFLKIVFYVESFVSLQVFEAIAAVRSDEDATQWMLAEYRSASPKGEWLVNGFSPL